MDCTAPTLPGAAAVAAAAPEVLMRSLLIGPRSVPLSLVVAVGVTVACLAAVLPDLPFHSEDSGWYLTMATGTGDPVPVPFSHRILHTGLAGALHRHGGLSPDMAFLSVALAALVCGLGCIAWLAGSSGPTPAAVAVLTVSWLAAATLRDATLPDALNLALIGVTLVAAARNRWLVLPWLLLAVANRETSAVLALAFAATAWREGDRRFAGAALLVAVASPALVHAAAGTPNVHGLGGLSYLVLKFPFNLARNLLGVELWVNTLDYCTPRAVVELPVFLRAGAVQAVGICGWNAVRPLTLLAAWLGLFGVMPGWPWGSRRRIAAAWPGAPLWVRAGFAYGIVLAAAAPAAGTSLMRLVGYGWPAFWLTGLLLSTPLPVRRVGRLRLAVLQAVTAIAVPALVAARPLALPLLAAAVVAGAMANLLACRLAAAPDRDR